MHLRVELVKQVGESLVLGNTGLGGQVGEAAIEVVEGLCLALPALAIGNPGCLLLISITEELS